MACTNSQVTWEWPFHPKIGFGKTYTIPEEWEKDHSLLMALKDPVRELELALVPQKNSSLEERQAALQTPDCALIRGQKLLDGITNPVGITLQ